MSPDGRRKKKNSSLLDRGLTHFHRGEYESAAEFLQEAILEKPDSYEAIYNLACCFSMLGDKDKSLSYLHRATKISPNCVDWAREDREFDTLRQDPMFVQILDGPKEEFAQPPKEEQPEEQAASEHAEEQQTAQKAPPPAPIPGDTREGGASNEAKETLPACTKCGGIVESETRGRYDVLVSLGVTFVGVLLCFATVFMPLVGLIGLPMVCAGLYFFISVDETWVCQACGATGADCGQPTETDSAESSAV